MGPGQRKGNKPFNVISFFLPPSLSLFLTWHVFFFTEQASSAAEEAEGDFLLNPVDDFLSTTTVAKGAVLFLTMP